MAEITKHKIDHPCGHTVEHVLVGSIKTQERTIITERNKLCPDCYRKQEEEETQRCIEANKDMGLPPLVGSSKQIHWAEKIRNHMIMAWLKERPALLNEFGDSPPEVLLETEQVYLASVSASEWIDSREGSLHSMIRGAISRHMRKCPACGVVHKYKDLVALPARQSLHDYFTNKKVGLVWPPQTPKVS